MELPKPINAEEKYLYAIAKNTEAMVELLDKLNKELEVAKEEKKEDLERPYDELTKSQIAKKLSDKGIEFNKGYKKDELLDLLISTEME